MEVDASEVRNLHFTGMWYTLLVEIGYIRVYRVPKYLANLTSGQLEALRQLSSSTGTPVAAYIRFAVDAYLSGSMSCSIMVSGQVVSGSALVIRV